MIVFQFTDELLKSSEAAAKTDSAIINALIFVAGVAVGMLIMAIIEYVKNHEL